MRDFFTLDFGELRLLVDLGRPHHRVGILIFFHEDHILKVRPLAFDLRLFGLN